MENPIPDPSSPPRLSSTSRTRRTSNDSNSPEFEFWMLRNPSCPQPNLLSADQLFSHGVLLPLNILNHNTHEPHPPEPSTSEETPRTEPGPEISRGAVTDSSSVLSGSKRWKDIFKKSDKKSAAGAEQGKEKDKEGKREKKSQLGASSGAELNIHLWPFSRSRSAGNGGARPRTASGVGGRKVSSAPCSRSNSAGESKSRKWPNSPGRTGVHLGRTSPVWQVRRSGSGRKNPTPELKARNAGNLVGKKEGPEPRRSKVSAGGGGAKARVLNLNVPVCIGYRNHISCSTSSNRNSATSVSVGDGGDCAGGGSHGGGIVGSGGGGTLFSILNLFTKKVY